MISQSRVEKSSRGFESSTGIGLSDLSKLSFFDFRHAPDVSDFCSFSLPFFSYYLDSVVPLRLLYHNSELASGFKGHVRFDMVWSESLLEKHTKEMRN